MRTAGDIYPHANTIICIEESKLLKKFEYDILYNAKGIQSALDELDNINYFHTYKSADMGNYGVMLDGLMIDTFDFMKKIVPDELIWRIFALYYDIHNMKLVVKERFFKKRLDNLALEYGSYSLPTMRSAAVRESDNILNNKILTRGFFEALGCRDMYDIDFILDKTYFKTLKKLAEGFEIPEIQGFVTERIDLFNVSVYFQYRAAGEPKGYFAAAFSEEGSFALEEWQTYIDGAGDHSMEKFSLWQKYKPIWEKAETKSQIFSELDVIIDNYLINKTKACKLMAFGIEPICAYFYNKLMEIKNIRILLTGKENGYPTEEIKKRMRIPYEL
ncbi:MAG: V-type ATPase subunit [Oscillospiraceae bacterium]|nr:V-type ATPase subunit [Oscillospiraceae bacterium]